MRGEIDYSSGEIKRILPDLYDKFISMLCTFYNVTELDIDKNYINWSIEWGSNLERYNGQYIDDYYDSFIDISKMPYSKRLKYEMSNINIYLIVEYDEIEMSYLIFNNDTILDNLYEMLEDMISTNMYLEQIEFRESDNVLYSTSIMDSIPLDDNARGFIEDEYKLNNTINKSILNQMYGMYDINGNMLDSENTSENTSENADEDFYISKLNTILDKVNENGIDSLSGSDINFLNNKTV